MSPKQTSGRSSLHATKLSRPGAADAPTKRRLSSDELLTGKKELVIEHGGDEYRLRITNNGKLLLTK